MRAITALPEKKIETRLADRCTSRDYLPVIGEIDADFLDDEVFPMDHPGKVMVNCGHGSKGLSSTPIAAEIISSHLLECPTPLPVQILERISPLRFTKPKKI